MRRVAGILLAGLLVIALSACTSGRGLGARQAGAGQSNPSRPAPALAVDCTAASQACPELVIAGDAPATLPNGNPSPARGYADPSLRRDPATGRIWMAYSWPHLSYSGRYSSVTVDTHLAHSDDNGETWTFDRALWTAGAATDPTTGETGFLNQETVSLYPRPTASGVVWYSARLQYFTRPASRFKINTFHLRVASAAAPLDLAAAPEGVLGGGLTPKEWRVDTDLAALSSELAGCTWSDPAILFRDDRLYLATQCWLFTRGGEQLDREFVALFATRPEGPAPAWTWSYLGKLSERRDAVELGGESLLQTDLAYGRDGALLAFFSPSTKGARLESHLGCRAVEVASLEPPRLARDAQGNLKLRASVTASDLAPSGPGACGYEPTSSTGIVIMRRLLGQGQLVGTLVKTGLRP